MMEQFFFLLSPKETYREILNESKNTKLCMMKKTYL